jgi:hypothetical protein
VPSGAREEKIRVYEVKEITRRIKMTGTTNQTINLRIAAFKG